MTLPEEEDELKGMIMSALLHDPDPEKKITNTDEQDVVVNHSTKEEGGYDEPVTSGSDDKNKEPDASEAKVSEEKKDRDNKDAQFK
jgi:hypothetical protein